MRSWKSAVTNMEDVSFVLEGNKNDLQSPFSEASHERQQSWAVVLVTQQAKAGQWPCGNHPAA